MGDLYSYSLSRYLNAKESVDERALNTRVLETFLGKLRGVAQSRKTLRLAELGVGTGASSVRFLSEITSSIHVPVEYILIEKNGTLLEEACRRLKSWARQRRGEVHFLTDCRLPKEDAALTICPVQGEALTWLEGNSDSLNAVIASSFADLENIKQQKKGVGTALEEGGVVYFALNPNGETTFLPPFRDLAFDRRVEKVYHESMSRSTPHGPTAGARTGQHLLNRFSKAPFELLDAGSSDWIVLPNQSEYPADEQYFLHHILRFVEDELKAADQIPSTLIKEWCHRRHRQVQNGELMYVGGHLDVVASVGELQPLKSGASST